LANQETSTERRKYLCPDSSWIARHLDRTQPCGLKVASYEIRGNGPARQSQTIEFVSGTSPEASFCHLRFLIDAFRITNSAGPGSDENDILPDLPVNCAVFTVNSRVVKHVIVLHFLRIQKS
jgi:hypothetical protein